MIAPVSQEVFRAVLRRDQTAFTQRVFHTVSPGDVYAHNWHIEAMTEALGKVLSGACRRLIITVPPRHMKSITTAVAFPAFALGHDPSLKFLVASYGGELAAKHARDFRMVVESPWYGSLFPGTVHGATRNTDGEFTTSRNGGRKAVSLGGALTGFGADIIIVDDLMKAADASSEIERQRVRDFFEQTLVSRLNDKRTGAIIVIQQRLHEDDLVGYLTERPGYTHINLRAIATEDEIVPIGRGRVKCRRKGEELFPDREPRDVLDAIRVDVGPVAFSAQYQQDPAPPDGAILRWELIETYDEQPRRAELIEIVQSWDVAVTATPKSDFSVCTTWGYCDHKWLLLDLQRVRLEFPELLGFVHAQRERWGPDLILIEKTGAGRPLFDALRLAQHRQPSGRHGGSWNLRAYDPTTDKLSRFAGQTARLQGGFARLPSTAPWLADLKRELIAFPNGRFDDQVDSISQFLDWAGKPRNVSRVEDFVGPRGDRRRAS